jgi:predicted nucleic acid-binding protein
VTSRIESFLDRHHRIALDTSVVIYAVEANPKYFNLASRIFTWLESEGHAVTSTLTMTEALVRPYRVDDIPAVDKFYSFLLTYPHLEWIAPTLHIADRAAQIRAEHNLRTPDAIQVATAAVSGATALISNDAIFRRIELLDILLLDEMLQ